MRQIKFRKRKINCLTEKKKEKIEQENILKVIFAFILENYLFFASCTENNYLLIAMYFK